MRRAGVLLAIVLAFWPTLANPADAARRKAPNYRYEVPVQQSSPWPSMRRDRRNTARSPIAARYRRGERPWTFRTAKGIFSTPVVAGDGTVYAGSADRFLYALGPRGRPRWRFRTGEIIDSAAVIGAWDRRRRTFPLTFGSGDEYLYRLRSGRRRMSRKRRTIWRFRANRKPATGQLVNWWEGNAVIGFGGTVFAGNTGGAAYAINPDGSEKWAYQTGNSVWTAPAMGRDGTTYWGSLDLFVYALDANGKLRWRTPTGLYVTSSPALSNDGTLYVGSFDGKLYALDASTGAVKWAFSTTDHVYSSPALAEDGQGKVTAIYIGSADGSVYAVSPTGTELWRYDTGDPVRSSPVIGRAPAGEGREIVYVGSSNGRLYALNADTGARRWSFDTTPRSAALRDRNDLNGSPALGRRGIYIGGEHGLLSYVPYDWCLHRRDRRCETSPGEAFADELTRIFPVTSGGSTLVGGFSGGVPAATVLNGRLVARRGGETQDASMQPLPTQKDLVQVSPPFDFTAQLSGDGHFIHVAPEGFLASGTDYEVRVRGPQTGAGPGGPELPLPIQLPTGAGTFEDAIRFRTGTPRGRLPLRTRRRRVSAFNLGRLAVPMPPLLPSVNQIGFDSYDLLAGTIKRSPPAANGEGRVLMWVIGVRRDRRGRRVADPKSTFAFPLNGRYRDDFLILSLRNLTLTLSFGDVPLRRFELRGQLSRNLRMRPGAGLYAEAFCPEVPNYGPLLMAIGLCNAEGVLPASGTFVTSEYRKGPANVRPRGLRVTDVAVERPGTGRDGSATARFALRRGRRYPARAHVPSILLTDAATGEAVPMDYRRNTRKSAGSRGDLAEVRLSIPAGTSLPERVRVHVIADVFPLVAVER